MPSSKKKKHRKPKDAGKHPTITPYARPTRPLTVRRGQQTKRRN